MVSQRETDGLMLYDPYIEEVPTIQLREDAPLKEAPETVDESRPETHVQQFSNIPVEDIPPSAPTPQPIQTQVDIVTVELRVPAAPSEDQLAEEVPTLQTKQLKVTQLEAMRQALSELGVRAKNADLAEYLRSRFDLVPKNIAVLKSNAKKSLREVKSGDIQPALSHREPAAEANDLSYPATPVVPSSQVENVQIQPEIATIPMIVQPTPAIPQVDQSDSAVEAESVREPNTETTAVFMFDIEDVALVKGLCDRLGKDTLLKLIDLLSL